MSTSTAPPELFLLVETAAGLLLAHVRNWEEIAQEAASVQLALEDPSRFMEMVSFSAFHPFANAEEALSSMQNVAAGTCSEQILSFLELSLPKKSKKKSTPKFLLAVSDPVLGKALVDAGVPATYNANAVELIRGCRLHLNKLAPQIPCLDKFHVGLGHSFSRTKIQFDPNRQDKPIMQSIALVDALDKNINSFAMRVREWYGWHFPELNRIITDNQIYCEVARIVRVRDAFVLDAVYRGNDKKAGEEKDDVEMEEETVTNREALVSACRSEEVMEEIMCASRMSMGQEITEMDMINIDHFARQVILLTTQRSNLHAYLNNKLNIVAPNLQTLLGDTLTARLISHAGSLVNLAKAPASTIQILGAEKALFRALKSKGNTPKYGLLFQSSFIGRAAQKSKGRISRCLANKCSLAARVDQFAPEGFGRKGLGGGEEKTKKKKKKKDGAVGDDVAVVAVVRNAFGESMRLQVEERLLSLAKRTN
eukprot:GHVS01103562.1.p1 GENE.GHVS01103562.1~~GHVS01103562.1.p1  ORF type:complete len:545 (+),score=97.07 GHVS01103562.1:194-1636(+)